MSPYEPYHLKQILLPNLLLSGFKYGKKPYNYLKKHDSKLITEEEENVLLNAFIFVLLY